MVTMSATVSTDLLLRVAQATPDQQAAIQRILGGVAGGARGEGENGVLARIERKLDSVLERMNDASREAGTAVADGEAAKVFVLMKRLEGARKQRKAPLLTVFRLLVLEGPSQRDAAARCGCVESLISARVKAIEGQFGMSIERLQALRSALMEVERTVKGDRRRRKSEGRADAFEVEDGEQEEAEGGAEGED